MKIISQTTDFFLNEDTVTAIGKFDGIHRGHEKIINKMREYKNKGLKLCIFSFNINPIFFLNNKDQKVLTTNQEKRTVFEQLDIDYLIEFPIDKNTVAIPARSFVEDILLKRLRTKVIVCGEDLSFGHKGLGNTALLKEYENNGLLTVNIVDKEIYKGDVISSTRIREKILSAEMEEANNMLMLPYMFFGQVIPGRKIGRTLGMPTVNLSPDTNKLLPKNGVYYSSTRHMGLDHCSITNIGVRPTFEDNKTQNPMISVETYLYDFEKEIYGDKLLIFLHHYVRPEKKFISIEYLRSRLKADIEEGRKWHGKHI